MTSPEFYHGPFTTDGAFIYSANGNMALMIADLSEKSEAIMERTCKILNDEILPHKAVDMEYKSAGIYLNGREFLVIRGRDMLTNAAVLNLPQDEAMRMQDEFGEWVTMKLSSYDKSVKL